MPEPSSERPPGIPDDYEQIMLDPKDGSTPIVVWGRLREILLPDGRKQLKIDGMIVPEE